MCDDRQIFTSDDVRDVVELYSLINLWFGVGQGCWVSLSAGNPVTIEIETEDNRVARVVVMAGRVAQVWGYVEGSLVHTRTVTDLNWGLILREVDDLLTI